VDIAAGDADGADRQGTATQMRMAKLGGSNRVQVAIIVRDADLA
jgi:hypothetical protein